MSTYAIGDLGRRELLMMSAVLAAAGMDMPTKLAAAEAALQRTPGQILGPFYPVGELPQSADLTTVPGRSGRDPCGIFCHKCELLHTCSMTGVQKRPAGCYTSP